MGARLSFPAADLLGKVAVVTGGNAGIGYETAKALAIMGAQTIIGCRSEERATEVRILHVRNWPIYTDLALFYLSNGYNDIESNRVCMHALKTQVRDDLKVESDRA